MAVFATPAKQERKTFAYDELFATDPRCDWLRGANGLQGAKWMDGCHRLTVPQLFSQRRQRIEYQRHRLLAVNGSAARIS